jgi:hypothetical protein
VFVNASPCPLPECTPALCGPEPECEPPILCGGELVEVCFNECVSQADGCKWVQALADLFCPQSYPSSPGSASPRMEPSSLLTGLTVLTSAATLFRLWSRM